MTNNYNNIIYSLIGGVIVALIVAVAYYRSSCESARELDTDKLIQGIICGCAFGAVAYLFFRVLLANLHLF